jgi:hypothetical protein
MPVRINGTTGLSGVDGSAGTPALQGSDTNTGIYFGTDVVLCSTSGSERWRVDSSGRLLVGTSSARSNIYVGGANPVPNVQFESVGNNYNAGLSLINYSALGFSPSLTLGLSLSNTAGTNAAVSADLLYGIINFVGNDGTNFRTGASIVAACDGAVSTGDLPTRLVFSTTADGASSPTERMRISNNGTILLAATDLTNGANIASTNVYVGQRSDSGSNSDAINSQNPALCASVYTTTNTGRATPALLVSSRTGASVGPCPLIKGYSGGENSNVTLQFLVSHNGNVQNTNNSYGSLSDERYKENIVDADSQWDDIKAIRIRKFNFKNDESKTTLLGIVAQEVENTSPGLIEQTFMEDGVPDPDVPKAVKYSVLYMKAVKALQEAMERIEQLETEKAAQQTVLDDLLARLTALESV